MKKFHGWMIRLLRLLPMLMIRVQIADLIF